MLLPITQFKSWSKALWAGVGLSLLALLSLEIYYRSIGYTPTISDTKELWLHERNRVYQSDGKIVVLLGKSRIQVGFDLNTFRKRFPNYRIVQLAVSNSDPIPLLIDLAQDKNFKGIIICSIDESNSLKYNLHEGLQAKYIHDFHYKYSNNWAKALDFTISHWLQNNLTILNPSLSLKNIIRHRHLPDIFHVRTFKDRSQKANYSKIKDLNKARQANINYNKTFYKKIENDPKYKPEAFIKDATKINLLVDKLKKRGCQVVFLRFPTNGPYWDDFEAFFPKKHYWDKIAKISSATMIHFQDDPSLSSFECPEGNHLDMKDAPAFTGALLDVLVAKGILNQKAKP